MRDPRELARDQGAPPTGSPSPEVPAVLAGAGLAFALVDAGGTVTAGNDTFADTLALPRAALAGRTLAELFSDSDLTPAELDFEVGAVVAGRRRRASREARVGDGRALSLTFTPAGTWAGRRQALLLVDDVTERRRADEEQERLRDLLGTAASEWRATFDAIDAPIFIFGAGNRAERLNRAARALAGRDFAELIGRRLADFGEGPLWQEAAVLVDRARAERRPVEAEVRDPASGRTWTLAASPGTPDLSEARPVILTVRELTRLVRLQESLRRSQTMAAMGALVAGVAHEVRNPLFGISSVVDALELRLADRGELGTHLAHLRHELGRVEKLMADLLDFGRPVTPEPEPVALGDVVDDAIAACVPRLEAAQVTIECRRDATQPVLLDRRRVCQALINLIENAAHHAPPGTPLEVRLESVARAGRTWAKLTLRDHGPGFRDADLPRLFEPFFSRREGGTGLGRPIVRRIVEGLGGEVEAANAPDGGAVVSLRFPLTAAPVSPAGGG
ncbi:MAG TPA: ATP-binding protein [Thermoanaerobaculia bacterium]|nr:ATP-binding protein [Thermoanaerobaculia bacterium]